MQGRPFAGEGAPRGALSTAPLHRRRRRRTGAGAGAGAPSSVNLQHELHLGSVCFSFSMRKLALTHGFCGPMCGRGNGVGGLLPPASKRKTWATTSSCWASVGPCRTSSSRLGTDVWPLPPSASSSPSLLIDERVPSLLAALLGCLLRPCLAHVPLITQSERPRLASAVLKAVSGSWSPLHAYDSSFVLFLFFHNE